MKRLGFDMVIKMQERNYRLGWKYDTKVSSQTTEEGE